MPAPHELADDIVRLFNDAHVLAVTFEAVPAGDPDRAALAAREDEVLGEAARQAEAFLKLRTDATSVGAQARVLLAVKGEAWGAADDWPERALRTFLERVAA